MPVLVSIVLGFLPFMRSEPPQAPADSGAYLIRLGVDTIGMERWFRDGDRIETTILARAPSTTVRRVVLVLGPEGSVVRVGSAPEGRPLEERPNAAPGSIPLASGSWVSWELVIRRASAAGGDSTTVAVLAGGQARPTLVRRVGPGQFETRNQFDQLMTVRVDAAGRMLSAELAGGGISVERVARLDLEAWAREFAARDSDGRGLGPLSPRDTTHGVIHGASISVAYGRPALRGRPLDLLVPPGEVWRVGANDATVLTADRPLRFGGLTLEPGSYSLFALPRGSRWTLIVNRQTGMSGLGRDPAQDLGRVAMRVRTDAGHTDRLSIEVRSAGAGGELVVRWGTVEATATFEVGT